MQASLLKICPTQVLPPHKIWMTLPPTPTPTKTKTPTPTPTPTPTKTPTGNTLNTVYITLYGYTDNSCQVESQHNCNDIAYPSASMPYATEGTGTYNNPGTLAGDPRFISPGTIVYIPKFSKYMQLQDSCAECITDYSNGKFHVDIYIGPSTPPINPAALINCEDQLTTGGFSDTIIVNPPSNLPVNTVQLYIDGNPGVCN